MLSEPCWSRAIPTRNSTIERRRPNPTARDGTLRAHAPHRASAPGVALPAGFWPVPPDDLRLLAGVGWLVGWLVGCLLACLVIGDVCTSVKSCLETLVFDRPEHSATCACTRHASRSKHQRVPRPFKQAATASGELKPTRHTTFPGHSHLLKKPPLSLLCPAKSVISIPSVSG
jgi:hypothetical protein